MIISVALGITFIIILLGLALIYSITRHRDKTLAAVVVTDDEKRPSINIDEFEMSKKANSSKDSQTLGNRRVS